MTTRFARLVGVLVLAVSALVLAAPRGEALPPFRCGSVSGGTPGFTGHITAVRVGQNTTFDRFVVQFREARAPHFRVTPQSSSRFVLDPSGRTVTLRGTACIRLVLNQATGIGSYHGPRDFRPPFPQLREARLLGDFESVTSWGLGLRHQSCKRVFVLSSPTRLVIDVPH
ncbi:MAG: AMIN-like domain-containing (lipo)protein [Jatrophihabitantaceae bacterium]